MYVLTFEHCTCDGSIYKWHCVTVVVFSDFSLSRFIS